MSKEIQAVLMLVGMIIGVGMFAIPFSFYAAGFWLGVFELCVLAFVVLAIHLCYGAIVFHTKGQHRLPGYARIYLGDRAAVLAYASTFFGIAGTLLAYMLLGGVFLHGLFAPFISASSPIFWSIIFVIVGACITQFPFKKETLINGILTALLIAFIGVLIFILLPRVNIEYLGGFHGVNAFAPYGVILFALSGATVIPDVMSFLKGKPERARRVIMAGSLIPAVIYFFFAFVVVGVSGAGVSPDAIAGLMPVAGRMIVALGNIIGLLAVITSYIALNSSFQAFLILDARVPRTLAWAGGSFLPLFLFVLGFQNFISVISVVGATTVAIDGGIIIATYHIILHRRERSITIADTIRFGLIYAIMIAGIGYELYRFTSLYIA
ncbi:MAG: aromatic amino acid transport family protein [Patescibacteria group bacterium]